MVVCLLAASTPMLASAQATVRVTDQGGRPVPYAVVRYQGANARIADDSGRVAIGTAGLDSL